MRPRSTEAAINRPPSKEILRPKETWQRPLDFVDEGFNPDASYKAHLETIVNNPETFLGKGGAGTVFDIGNGWCIKLMENRHTRTDRSMFDLGNSTQQEAAIQFRLNDYEASGVRAPKVLSYQTGPKTTAILMERFDAIDLQYVLADIDTFPSNFDPDTFIDALDDYIQGMHVDYGIAHLDLAPRNVMIDRQTALPRVIDFGRSRVLGDNTQENDNLCQVDLNCIDDIHDKITAKLKRS